MKCSIQRDDISPHESICTIALTNIHYLYTMCLNTYSRDRLIQIGKSVTNSSHRSFQHDAWKHLKDLKIANQTKRGKQRAVFSNDV